MGKSKEKPRRNVVAFRVTDDEKKQLEKIVAASGKPTVGDVMRDRLFGKHKGRA